MSATPPTARTPELPQGMTEAHNRTLWLNMKTYPDPNFPMARVATCSVLLGQGGAHGASQASDSVAVQLSAIHRSAPSNLRVDGTNRGGDVASGVASVRVSWVPSAEHGWRCCCRCRLLRGRRGGRRGRSGRYRLGSCV